MNQIDILTEILQRDLPVPKQATINTSTQVVTTNTIITVGDNNTPTEDANSARQNIRSLLSHGNMAVQDLLQLARTSSSPRAYEVLATLLKTIAEMNHDLMDIHKSERELSMNGETGGDVHNHIEKAVFVGSTTELGELVKQQRNTVDANTTHQN